MHTVNSYQE